MKLTRRQLAAALAPVVLPPAMARAQAGNPPAGEELEAARERLKANAQALAATNVPMATEPAFQFKA
jgi:hypothetical protein